MSALLIPRRPGCNGQRRDRVLGDDGIDDDRNDRVRDRHGRTAASAGARPGSQPCCCRARAASRISPATDDTDLPAFVRRAIEGMRAVLAGTADDLLDVPVDHRGIDDFRRAVYEATRRIAPGTTRSYGEVARAIARPDAARDVGVALSRNPTPIIVPCHRVVAASGALTGFSAPGGLATKRTDARARRRPRLRPAAALRLTGRRPRRLSRAGGDRDLQAERTSLRHVLPTAGRTMGAPDASRQGVSHG